MEIPTVRVAQAIEMCNAVLGSMPLRVQGEVSGFTLSRGKFVFFDLKDEEEEAQLEGL